MASILSRPQCVNPRSSSKWRHWIHSQLCNPRNTGIALVTLGSICLHFGVRHVLRQRDRKTNTEKRKKDRKIALSLHSSRSWLGMEWMTWHDIFFQLHYIYPRKLFSCSHCQRAIHYVCKWKNAVRCRYNAATFSQIFTKDTPSLAR